MIRIPVTVRRLAVLVALLLGVATLTPAATATSAATTRSITVKASTKVTAIRSIVTFTGTVTKSPRRTPVQLQRKIGTRWTKVASTTTRTAAGAYAVNTVLPATIGTYAYRTFSPATGSLRATTSAIVRVTALRKVTTTIKANPTSVPAGGSSTISGTVRPFVAGTRVVIQKQDGLSWSSAAPAGTVNAKGSYSVKVPTAVATTYRAAVARAGKNAPSFSIGVRVDTTPVIATTALPDATRKQAYSFKVTAVGGAGGTWSATGLPTGLSMTSNGSIGGITEVAAGDYPVTINFTRVGGAVAPAKILTLTVLPAQPPVISSAPLANAKVGDTYTAGFHAIGEPAGTWSATGLPAGLTLNETTGAVTGSPAASGIGAHEITVNFDPAEAGVGNAAPKVFDLVVDPPTIKTSAIAKPSIGQLAYSAQIELSGTVAVPGTWSLVDPPSGYSINNSGKISNGLVLNVPASLTVMFTITGAPPGTPPLTRTYTFS